MAFDTKKFLYYFRLTPDHRLLFGGRTSFARIDDGEACRVLAAAMREVFPQLADRAVDYSWSGNVGFTFDQLKYSP
jgi:glycine/D-amino acid oxidase-like deaminating enzyme